MTLKPVPDDPAAYEEDGEAIELFKLLSPADLAKPVPPMQWLVRGVWPEGSHGPIAGAKKTLKSYNGLALDIAIASGEDYLATFPVEVSGPVLIYVGEGGLAPFQRRYQRMCEAYNVAPEDIPVYAVVNAAPINSRKFEDSLKAHLDEVQPVAFHLDSLYNYHPPKIEAQNLYERGHMLAELSELVGHETAMFIGDHYRKSGADKLDLDEIAQAGVAQWADSWILQAHRKEPDVDGGQFYLGAVFGSRQWGGRSWDIDFSIGHFDDATCEHDGDIVWTVEPAGTRAVVKSRVGKDEVREAVLKEVAMRPPTTRDNTARNVMDSLGVGRNTVINAFKDLAAEGAIEAKRGRVKEGTREVNRDVWVPGDGRVPRLKTSSKSRK